MTDLNYINNLIVTQFVDGRGDATSKAVVPAGARAKGVLHAKCDCVAAGLPVAEAVFRKLDPKCVFTAKVREGARCTPGTVLAEVVGDAASLLTAERTALNFLQRLCPGLLPGTLGNFPGCL